MLQVRSIVKFFEIVSIGDLSSTHFASMADTFQAAGVTRAVPVHNNRISARSTRKKKTTILSPKKFCDQVTQRVPAQKGFENGCADFYREFFLESPTFRHFFKPENKEKIIFDQIWLYDATRVILPDGDFIHASWVDGFKPLHYILVQAPHDEPSKKTFFKMLAHVKPDGLIVAEGSDEITQHISTNFERAGAKKSAEKPEDLIATTVISENGVNKLKAVKLCKWTQPQEKDMSPAELNESMLQARKFLGSPLKGPMVIVCKDGVSKSGVIAYLDTEADRYAKVGRVRANDTVKALRFQRYYAFERWEMFDLAILALVEMMKPFKNKK